MFLKKSVWGLTILPGFKPYNLIAIKILIFGYGKIYKPLGKQSSETDTEIWPIAYLPKIRKMMIFETTVG